MKKIAIITGSAKRLGKTIALQLAKMNYELILHYHHSQSEVLELQKELAAQSVDCLPLQADLSQPQACHNLIEQAKEWKGHLDLLVNNASVFLPDELPHLELNDLEKQLNVNAIAPLSLIQHFANRTEEGLIINLIDTRIDLNDTHYFSYSLSKMLLANITEMAAKALSPRIRVVGIAPGAILAPDQSIDLTITGNKKLKGIDRSAQIASTVEYIVNNNYLTGEIIHIDGGLRLNKKV